eukprot:scaffold6.g2917.t1
MAGRGGDGRVDAATLARMKQYDYRANSNLVLTAEQRTATGREPDGSAESLWGKMVGRMGDRAQAALPEGLAERKSKRAKRPEGEEGGLPARKRRAGGAASVLDIDTAGTYRPRTRETREAYEALLSVIQAQFGDQPQEILRGAADEVLASLKNERLTDPARQKEVSALLGPVPDEKFAQLVALGKLITDWVPDVAAAAAAAAAGEGGEGLLDEDIGVAVEFEDEDEEDEEEELAEVVDEEDEEGEGEETLAEGEGVRTGMDVEAGEEGREEGISEIDAYWLQRRISKAFGGSIDPNQAQQMAEDVFAALQLSDPREVENRLVTLLDFDRFELIKELLANRLRVVWCMRLARAQDDEERARIEAEMEGGEDTRPILEALHATRATARERQTDMERKIREEARRLRASGGAAGERGGAGAAASGRKNVDLDNLSFHQGSRFNSSKTCTLPQGSYRTVHKGFEEVHVPALKPKPFGDGEHLKEVTELPEWAQAGFSWKNEKGEVIKIKSLNRIQSKVCDAALYSAENMLVCAPTGAGKTNVALLTMLHEIGLHRREDSSIDTSAFKIIYIAPMKARRRRRAAQCSAARAALVAEMVGNFAKRLEPYGVKVRELTGDVSMTKQEIEETQLIIVTPEKWDIITRKSGDRAYTQLVRLVIIDEIHLLHDERGSVLESIVARTVRQIEVMEAAGKHQVLIFVHSRKETAKTARFLKEEALKNDTLVRFLRGSASRETEAESVKSSDLRELLPYGLGIHHAGMARADRTLVEDLFGDGHIQASLLCAQLGSCGKGRVADRQAVAALLQHGRGSPADLGNVALSLRSTSALSQVLVSTATLAWGVNLPAHTVIIKGTQVYNPVKGAWAELSPLDVMQMFGRAGRPQFDTFGEGIIITTHSELQFYLSLLNMQLPIESQYVATIPDNLNAEVVLGTVQNIRDAATWLGYTYLYVRMLCNPQLYGVPLDALDADALLQERRLDLAHSAALLLDKNNLVKYDRRTGNLQPTDLGRIASHYYVTYRTIATFNEHLKPTMGEIELLRLFALADEFQYMVVREEEKMEVAKLLDRVPIPVKEGLDEPAAKINVLLQAYISQLKLEGLALTSDMVYVTQSAGRLMRCLFEVCLRRGWAGLAERALALCKCVNARMWASQTPLRQFKGIPGEILQKIERKDLPWERWYDLSSQEIGELIRFPKMGKTLHRRAGPRSSTSSRGWSWPRTVLKVDLTITPDFQWEDKVHGVVEPFFVIAEDADSEHILHTEYFVLKKSLAEEDHLLSFTLPITEPLPPQYFVRVVSDRWLGCEAVLPISFRHLLLPAKAPPPTELLDLQPLPVSALRNPQFEALYPQFTHFNPIQTQVFTALYNTDDNVLLCAPTGSGKTIAAEFAVLRAVQRAADGKAPVRVVYVGPVEAIAKERFEDWSAKFGAKGLGLNVVQLTGEAQADLKLLERGNIVIATPEQWDMLSRRWKQRKAVQQVALFIADEMHLLGGPHGPALEITCSRMRYISSQLDSPIRIVGLAASLANAKDLGEWLGATSHGLFNFPPGVRPVPLEIHIQGFDIVNLEARIQAMSRPAYSAVCQHARDGKPAIVFVPTRKHARMTALDLLTHAAAEGQPFRFRQAEEADLAPYLERAQDPALRHSLGYGVAFLHETQSASEQELARLLFSSGACQVLVATAPMCWGLTAAAKLVVIMGTQYYDVTGQGTNDYPVTDLLQMMGRASRPLQDDQGICVLMCHGPRKEYYKKFLFEPLPVESHVDHFLHDHMTAEVVTRTIQNKQDAVDYLTWTFYYRRLTQNPNYYNMLGVTHRHVSDHLSDLVETVLSDLEQSKMIAIEDDMDLEPLNLGMIAAYYYTAYTTLELFAASLTAKTKLKGLLEILASATEFGDMPVRLSEDLLKLLAHAPLALDKPKYTDPHTKVNALLQTHFSRGHLNPDLRADQQRVLRAATRLLQAMVDVISSSGWLNPALAAMEMSQMVAQALWQRDPALLQLPHFTRELADKCAAAGVEGVFDLMEMEDDARRELLQLSEPQLEDVARWCNRFPDISVSYELAGGPGVMAGEPVSLAVALERDGGGEEGGPGPVDAPHYPGRKDENWWLVVGDPAGNGLLAIKRVALQASGAGMAGGDAVLRRAKVRLDFVAPATPGPAALTLFFMCDSYLGCDQEFELALDVVPGEEGEEEAGEEAPSAMEQD